MSDDQYGDDQVRRTFALLDEVFDEVGDAQLFTTCVGVMLGVRLAKATTAAPIDVELATTNEVVKGFRSAMLQAFRLEMKAVQQ